MARGPVLLVSLCGDFDEVDVRALREVAAVLARIARWTLGPPAFVDETDDSSCTRPDDQPIRTVGAVLDVTDPGASGGTPVEEVVRFIDVLAWCSAERRIVMEVQLGDIWVGEIERGVLDRGIRDGLLAAW